MVGKRFLVVLGSFVTVGGLLSGCGSSGGSTSGGGGGSTSASTPTTNTSSATNNTSNSTSQNKPAAKPIKITFWNAYSTTDAEESTITKKVIPAFEKKYPNITVQNVTLPYSKMQTKLLTSAAGGELPDVARLDIVWMAQLANLGTLLPEDSMPGFDSLKSTVFKGSLSTALYHGKYYGLPLDTNTKALFSNTAVLQKAGISQPPTTMKEFVADIKKTTSGTGKNKHFGYILPGTSLWQLVPWISSYGGSVLSPDGKTAQGYLNGPKTVQAITTLVNLFKQGYITGLLPGAAGDMTGLGKGQFAMIDEGPWDVPAMKTTFPNVKYKLSLFPAGAGGSREVVGGEDIGIFKTDSAHEQAAWKFEQFMLTPQVQGWMQDAGQMSVLQNLPSSDVQDPGKYKLFREQLKTAVARPVVANFSEIVKYIGNAVTEAAQGKMTVKQALDQATKQVDAALK